MTPGQPPVTRSTYRATHAQRASVGAAAALSGAAAAAADGEPGAVVLFISPKINFSPPCRDLTATPSLTQWT